MKTPFGSSHYIATVKELTMTKQELIDYCLTFPAAYEDYPFGGQVAHSDDGTWTVMRHDANKKSFAHIYNRNGKLCINLKCEPIRADFLRGAFSDIVPGWHMNKTHWNTIYVDGDVPKEELYDSIQHSYNLVKPKQRKKRSTHSIREITPVDYSQLENFLYHAIFIPEGEEYPAREIIFQPEIYVYVKDFGGKNDSGVVAEIDGLLVGAAWARIIPAYGNIDDKTPELAISILPEFRGNGIGTDLMNSLFDLLRKRGYVRTSLSVQQNNPAVRFYQRLGYLVTDEKLDHTGHEDFIMIKNL